MQGIQMTWEQYKERINSMQVQLQQAITRTDLEEEIWAPLQV